MATKSSFWLRGKKGRLAGTTVYTSKGRTIQREIVDVANPQTRAQMEQRVKWPNLVNFYKVMKPVLKYAFENKKQAQSDYNALMSINASRDRVPCMTKNEARQGLVVPSNFQISQGTLQSVTGDFDFANVSLGSKIKVAAGFDITESTTIAQLSTAIIAENAFIREGMQLSLVVLSTTSEDSPGYATLHKEELILNMNSPQLVAAYMPQIFVSAESAEVVGTLSADITLGTSNAGAFIISETISGKTSVSTEQLVLDENALAAEGKCSSITALNNAILSYGVAENAFLNSTEANKA